MGRCPPKSMKARRRGEEPTVPSIHSLPTELMVIEVLSRVAASCFKDLFNIKLSCRVYCQLCDDKHVLQRMSLEKFPVVPEWIKSEKASSFFQKCKQSGNPEALYRQGLIEFFTHMRVECGIEHLRKAASSGHTGALYAMGIVLLFGGNDDSKQHGMEVVAKMRRLKAAKTKVRECHQNLKAVLSQIWIRNDIIKRRPICCAMRDEHMRNRIGRFSWCDIGEEEEDEDNNDNGSVRCEACRCDDEVDAICNVLHVV